TSISGSSAHVRYASGNYILGGTNNSSSSSLSVTGRAINQTTVSAAAIFAAGSGYKKNDTLTVVGGTFVFPTKLKVLSVNGSGAILTFTTTSGAYSSSTPGNPVVVSGGTGTGAKFNLTFQSPP